jgi:UDP-glucose 4-epimerase
VIPIFIDQSLTDQPITVDGDGLQTRSFIHVDDVVEATILAGQSAETDFHILNISGTESISIVEIASLILKYVADTRSQITHGPARLGDVRDSIGSIERVSKLLNFTPEVSLETGLERTVSWYKFIRSM